MARRAGTASGPSAGQVARWAVLTVLMAAAAGATGYVAAEPTENAVAEPPPPPRLIQIDAIYASGRADGARAARKRGERSGYREGLRYGRRVTRDDYERRYRRGGPAYERIAAAGTGRALEAFELGADGFYVVGVRDGGKQVDATHGPLESGGAYELCRDGAAVCFSGGRR